VAKIQGVHDAVQDKDGVTALNFYYNKSCLYDKSEHEMFTWAQANIPIAMRDGLDYVFFSYYEDDCNGVSILRKNGRSSLIICMPFFSTQSLDFGKSVLCMRIKN
jgi:hypothetical protein